jgi:type II secretory pathway pseudopilin PulG
MFSPIHQTRRGISLLEVLISMGILAVGLASVMALLPAGGSQARRAMIEDRRGAIGAAVLSDIVNRGFLNPATWTSGTAPPVVFDGIGDSAGLATDRFPTSLTKISVTGSAATTAFNDEVFRGQDDLSFTIPEDETQPPVAKYFTGNIKRLSEGNFSWLGTIVASGTAPNTDFYRLSVVEFYKRPLDNSDGDAFGSFNATFAGTSAEISQPMSKDRFKALFSAGSVVLVTDATHFRWLKVLMASPTENATGDSITAIDLTFNQDVADLGFTPNMIYAYAGAVGVAEKIVRLEGDSPWSGP